jgi:glycosyltransferase involved in cell wall biosynthesis
MIGIKAMRPLVSVVIPAYNAERFLGQAVASVLAQSYRDLELIIVDDGSDDGTPGIIRALEAASVNRQTMPVRGIFQSNSGPSRARNRGIEEAQGAYVAFLDADDRWHPEKLERQIAVLEADPALGVCVTGWRIITESGAGTKRTGGAAEGLITFEMLLEFNRIITPSVVGRTALFRALGGFDPSMRHCEDFDLWLRITLSDHGQVWSIAAPLTDRRERLGQLTGNWRAMHEGWTRTLGHVRNLAPERVRGLERIARASNDRYCAFLAYQAGDYPAARALTWSAWRAAPLALLCSRRAYPTTLAAIASLLPRPLHRRLSSKLRHWREGTNTTTRFGL